MKIEELWLHARYLLDYSIKFRPFGIIVLRIDEGSQYVLRCTLMNSTILFSNLV